jgi:hypothetical protein
MEKSAENETAWGLVYVENFYFRSVKLSQFVPIGSEQSLT